jgi:hypothetical protein
MKMAEVGCAALIPFIANYSSITAAFLGFAIVLFEAIQHLNQWNHNWITYRSTCEALRHEKYSFLGRSGPYDGLDEESAKKVLVERVEALISTEHSKWISSQERAGHLLERKR